MADTQERSRDPPEESYDGEGIHTDELTDEKVLKNNLNLNKDQSDSNGENKEGTKKNQDVQIGNRTATLFLSSHSLKLQDKKKNNGNYLNLNSQSSNSPIVSPSPIKQSNTTLSSSSRRSSRLNKKDREIPDELKFLPKIQKEFTFTGYDIMADVEPTEEIDEEEKEVHNLRQLYLNSCKKVGVIPVSLISRQIGGPEMVMRSHSLGPLGARAIAIALVDNKLVSSLDLEDNGLGPEGAICIGEMLEQNSFLTYLSLRENLIGTEGLRAICNGLKGNPTLQTLDLTGSGFVDSDAYIIAEILENNTTLREVILSHNNFCEKGGVVLAAAIAVNDFVRILDVSWNHLRGNGAKAMGAALQKNIGLRRIDLSWNGYGKDECFILGKAIKENTTLKELDLSNNRINTEAVGCIMEGIQVNDGLEILRMGGNPITPEVALVIVKVIQNAEQCRITQLDLADIDVDEEFVSLVDEIQGLKDFRVIHGYVIKHQDSKKKTSDGIDGNLDAVSELYKYMHENNYRVIDLMKWLDKDGSMSISREEFKKGMLTAEVPITEHQLDKMLDKLDMDGDGEVDFRKLEELLNGKIYTDSELLVGERAYRRKMRAKRDRVMLSKSKPETFERIVLAKITEDT